MPLPTRESPIRTCEAALQRQPRSGRPDLVWQPRFAYGTAGVVLATLFLLTLPLWVVLFRMTDPAANNGAGPNVSSLLALCMMLMGVFLTGAATWMILVEMRARVRIVDALAGIRERELAQLPARALDPDRCSIPLGGASAPDEMNQPVTAPIPAGAGAHQPARRRPRGREPAGASFGTTCSSRSVSYPPRSPCSPSPWPCSSAPSSWGS